MSLSMPAPADACPEPSRGAAAREATISRLRAEIRRVHAAPRQFVLSLHAGLEPIDALGIWRLGGCVELSGELASGRTSLALKAVAAAGHEGRLSAWVDGPGELYPPAAIALGVQLEQLLIVRPKAPGQLVWSTVQLLRSGAFTCVVLDLNRTGVRLTLQESKKLSDAARAGGGLLVLLTAQEAHAEGLVRLVLTTPAPSLRSVFPPVHPESSRAAKEQQSGPPPPAQPERRPQAEVEGPSKHSAHPPFDKPRMNGVSPSEMARASGPAARDERDGDDRLEIEVAHSRQGTGRRLQLPRSGLFAGHPPRLRRCPHLEATHDEPASLEPFVRRKKNLQREGFQPPDRPVGEAAPTMGCGIRNGRPGRDAPDAPLRQLLIGVT